MNIEMDNKEFLISLIYFILGAFGIMIFVGLMINFEAPIWFYHPVSLSEQKMANNVTNLSCFTYFTYLSMLLFSVWAVLRFFAVLINFKPLKNALNNGYLLLFLTTIQILTCVLYTTTQFFSAIPFGFIDFKTQHFIDFLNGLFMHYVLTLSCMLYFFKFSNSKPLNFKYSLLILIFPLIYGIMTKLIGKFAFKIEWYPYPIFSTQSIWIVVFKNLETFDFTLAVCILCLVYIISLVAFVLTIYLLTKYTNRTSNLKRNNL